MKQNKSYKIYKTSRNKYFILPGSIKVSFILPGIIKSVCGF